MSYLNESPIRVKSFEFACNIVLYCDKLKENKDFELASQLLRSGTSIGTNTREAQRGVSKKDFKNKFGIALKEADETMYWLDILEATGRNVPKDMKIKCEELIRILVSIIKNS
ncbi:MAG TPA: four helix bundle protein [Maribacter sp.]|uniref:four helix bundle protein n=1 Tax=unclassified Maribacter TaxID=2615042 RepID=UPI000EDF0A94|nr:MULTISPECIES: four helix bundle protein [unclassified Maribacter]HAF77305.1 four helix bundle protein [Maribacter sp.]HAI39367.1 four helix bundle protein [Maribacter sp.]|tara:strand:- start:116 stop:454 length:339 start_codon:yes stop_codon:yes gene_type:complete